jgi:hypothetical protein
LAILAYSPLANLAPSMITSQKQGFNFSFLLLLLLFCLRYSFIRPNQLFELSSCSSDVQALRPQRQGADQVQGCGWLRRGQAGDYGVCLFPQEP